MNVVVAIHQGDHELVGAAAGFGNTSDGLRILAGEAGCACQEHARGSSGGNERPFRPGEAGDAGTGFFVQLVEVYELPRGLDHGFDHGRGHDRAAQGGNCAAGVYEGAQAEAVIHRCSPHLMTSRWLTNPDFPCVKFPMWWIRRLKGRHRSGAFPGKNQAVKSGQLAGGSSLDRVSPTGLSTAIAHPTGPCPRCGGRGELGLAARKGEFPWPEGVSTKQS